MKKWAVAFVSFLDNELTIEIVEEIVDVAAIKKHSKVAANPELVEFILGHEEGSFLDEVKKELFDMDILVDVVEIPQ